MLRLVPAFLLALLFSGTAGLAYTCNSMIGNLDCSTGEAVVKSGSPTAKRKAIRLTLKARYRATSPSGVSMVFGRQRRPSPALWIFEPWAVFTDRQRRGQSM